MALDAYERAHFMEGEDANHGNTFITALTSTSVGLAVTVSGSYLEGIGICVKLVSSGEQVLGKLARVESDGACNVQGKNWRCFYFVSGSTPSLGQGIIGGSVDGYIAGATPADGGRGFIADVDLVNLKVLVLL